MDLLNPPSAFSDSNATMSDYDVEKEKKIALKRVNFYSSYYRQSFSLPFDSIIYYITMNPSTPKVYQKLIKSCKHFFIKNPILIVSHLRFDFRDGCYYYDNVKYIHFNNLLSNIWVTEQIFNESHRISSVISKIFQNDASELILHKQNIAYKDFIFLASKCKTIRLFDITVIDEDGSVVTVEKLLEVLPQLKTFNFEFSSDITASNVYTSKTAQELVKIPHFSNLEEFAINQIPETFDIQSFNNYIKSNKKTKIYLIFSNQISDAYKIRLQNIVNEILQTENREYKIPGFNFQGME